MTPVYQKIIIAAGIVCVLSGPLWFLSMILAQSFVSCEIGDDFCGLPESIYLAPLLQVIVMAPALKLLRIKKWLVPYCLAAPVTLAIVYAVFWYDPDGIKQVSDKVFLIAWLIFSVIYFIIYRLVSKSKE